MLSPLPSSSIPLPFAPIECYSTVCTVGSIDPSINWKLIGNKWGKWLLQAPQSLPNTLSLRLMLLSVSWNITVCIPSTRRPGQLTWYMVLSCSLYHTNKSSLILCDWLPFQLVSLIFFKASPNFCHTPHQFYGTTLFHFCIFFSHFSMFATLLLMGNTFLYSFLHLAFGEIWKIWWYLSLVFSCLSLYLLDTRWYRCPE